MPSPPAIFRKPGEGRVISMVGDAYRFLATSEETGGTYALWEATVPPGGGPPPHVHSREQEGFYILDGEMTFHIGDDTIVAGPGTFLNASPGTKHSFRNESDKSARMLISVAPGGLEKMFFEVGQPMNVGEAPPPPSHAEIEKLLAAAPRYGVEILPPPH